MSEQISIGDLVMVVRWPCCGMFVGVPFIVSDVFRGDRYRLLCSCGTQCEGPAHLFVKNRDGVEGGLCNAPVAWLKKIDPPAIDEISEECKELTA